MCHELSAPMLQDFGGDGGACGGGGPDCGQGRQLVPVPSELYSQPSPYVTLATWWSVQP